MQYELQRKVETSNSSITASDGVCSLTQQRVLIISNVYNKFKSNRTRIDHDCRMHTVNLIKQNGRRGSNHLESEKDENR